MLTGQVRLCGAEWLRVKRWMGTVVYSHTHTHIGVIDWRLSSDQFETYINELQKFLLALLRQWVH